jgi:hypothetical protein
MMKPTTEQAYSSLPVANQDEARDLDSQRASSFLDLDHHVSPSLKQDLEYWGSQVKSGGLTESHDFLPTSADRQQSATNPAARTWVFPYIAAS